jgi:hypothetical protein
MRPNTHAEAIERISAGAPRGDTLAEFVDTFLALSDDAARLSALAASPKRTDDARLDALAGAVGEYLAKHYRLPQVPHWVSEPWRRLADPWFTTSSTAPGMREYLTFASPAEFRSRNIFTEERPLRRACTALAERETAR